MTQNMGRGIIAPDSTDNISSTGVQEMRTIASTTAIAIGDAKQEIEASLEPKLKAVDWFKGDVSSGQDLNLLTTPGVYSVRTGSVADTLVNAPEDAYPGHIEVFRTTNGIVTQRWTYYGAELKIRQRTTVSINSGSMSPWLDVFAAVGRDAQVAGLANHLRVDDFSQRWGGVKKTGGLPVISLRFDHGLTNFNAKIRPLLEARNIPYTLALSSRHWGHAENSGVTPAMVNDWIEGGLCTVANHGADAHKDVTTYDDLYDQIAVGLQELRDQLPSAIIDMWMVPGVGGSNYNGFDAGSSPEKFYGTEAGRLILEHHALSSGAFPDSQMRVLDGRVRQGQRHVTIDAATVSAINSRINQAKDGPYGVQFMLHPSVLDQADKITISQLTQVFDSIATQRDQGELMVMHAYDLALADATVDEATLRLVSPGIYQIGAM